MHALLRSSLQPRAAAAVLAARAAPRARPAAARRLLCAEAPKSRGQQAGEDGAMVLTPGQKVQAAGRGAMLLTLTGVAGVCAYYIGKELMPSRMNPNKLFSEAFDVVEGNPDVTYRLGQPLKGYGRDHGGHKEGRRNFIENTATTAADGTEQLRIRFNVEGPYGHAYVFCEARKGSNKGEYNYLMVQFTKTGEVLTLIDNRHLQAFTAESESEEGKDALRQLLEGGEKS